MKRKVLQELNCISRIILNTREAELSKYNLKRGQQTFLTRIVENPGISQKELSAMIAVNKGTTAKAIKKLIDAGFITKNRSKENFKTYELFATPSGLDLYPELIEKIEQSGDKAFKDVDYELLYSLLKQVHNNLK